MMHRLRRCRSLLAPHRAITALAFAIAAAAPDLPDKAYQIINDRCVKCHGKLGPKSNFNILDQYQLIKSSKKYVVPRDAGGSLLFQMVEDQSMPQGGRSLSGKEIAVIREWIANGALPWTVNRAGNPFVSTKDVYQAIEADLSRRDEGERMFARYFAMHHLFNNPTVSDGDLAQFRAALSKLMNSLSWKPYVVVPEAIDSTHTLFRLDLRDLGWEAAERGGERDLWEVLAAQYPYSLSYQGQKGKRDPDGNLGKLDETIRKWTGSEIPVIRADWFVAKASKAPLYDRMLRLPKTDVELESRLGVVVSENYQRLRHQRWTLAQKSRYEF